MNISVANWQDVELLGTWVWPRFSPRLMSCGGGRGCDHCGGRLEINAEFMDRLSALREEYNQPLVETSGYRCPGRNAGVSKTGKTGPHTTGRAIDIAIYGESAYWMIKLAFEHGFTGVGIRQTGRHASRIVHLDDLQREDGMPRPRVWTY